MRTKLLAALTGAILLASIGVSNARELQILTDTQLDVVTAGSVAQSLVNAATQGALVFQSNGFIELANIVEIINQINVNVCVSCRSTIPRLAVYHPLGERHAW